MPKVELIDTSGLPEVEPRSNLSFSQRVPCKFFFGSGNCTKDPCPFSHDPNCKLPKSHDPARVKGGDFAVGKGKTNFSGGDFKGGKGKGKGKGKSAFVDSAPKAYPVKKELPDFADSWPDAQNVPQPAGGLDTPSSAQPAFEPPPE